MAKKSVVWEENLKIINLMLKILSKIENSKGKTIFKMLGIFGLTFVDLFYLLIFSCIFHGSREMNFPYPNLWIPKKYPCLDIKFVFVALSTAFAPS